MNWTFERDRCALIVVDMQNCFVREGAPIECAEARRRMPRMRALIDRCREFSVPVFYTMDNPDVMFSPLRTEEVPWLEGCRGRFMETEEAQIVEELAPEPGDVIVKKHRFSAFFQTDLELKLRSVRGAERPVDTVIICGTVTNVCCESTARDAYFRDFKVVFGDDVCAAFTPEAHKATIDNINNFFGRVMDSEAIVAALEAGRG